jgi:Ni,Fe-hydrogenase III large subunit
MVERICGACSVANAVSFCQAVEKLSYAQVPRRAELTRVVIAEMERLYNHVGDTGNLCAGAGFTVPNAMGTRLKEDLLRCNEKIAGNRFLRGMIVPGEFIDAQGEMPKFYSPVTRMRTITGYYSVLNDRTISEQNSENRNSKEKKPQ